MDQKKLHTIIKIIEVGLLGVILVAILVLIRDRQQSIAWVWIAIGVLIPVFMLVDYKLGLIPRIRMVASLFVGIGYLIGGIVSALELLDYLPVAIVSQLLCAIILFGTAYFENREKFAASLAASTDLPPLFGILAVFVVWLILAFAVAQLFDPSYWVIALFAIIGAAVILGVIALVHARRKPKPTD